MKRYVERRLSSNEKEFPSPEWSNTFDGLSNTLLDIGKIYKRKIGKIFTDTAREAKATDFARELYDKSIRSLRGSINKQRIDINAKITYYWNKIPNVREVPVGGFSNMIPVSKIVRGIYPGLREIVFFAEIKFQINFNLGKMGYFCDLLKGLEYPVIVFPDVVRVLNRKSSNEIVDILKHYDEVERRGVGTAALHLSNIVSYIKHAVKFLEENDLNDKKSIVPNPERANEKPNDAAEHSTALAGKEMSNSNDIGSVENKAGQDLVSTILGHELADEEIERSFVEVRRTMIKRAQPPKHAFNYDIEIELNKEIEESRTALLDALPRPENSLKPRDEVTKDVQDMYDDYILKVNDIFSRYMSVILNYLANKKIIRGPFV